MDDAGHSPRQSRGWPDGHATSAGRTGPCLLHPCLLWFQGGILRHGRRCSEGGQRVKMTVWRR